MFGGHFGAFFLHESPQTYIPTYCAPLVSRSLCYRKPCRPTSVTTRFITFLSSRVLIEDSKLSDMSPAVSWDVESKKEDNRNIRQLLISTFEITPSYAHESALVRGLQIPSRISLVSSGFKYPVILRGAGVTPHEWAAFTSEVKTCASLSITQWMATVAFDLGITAASAVSLGVLAIPAAWAGYTWHRRREHKNLCIADQCGVLSERVNRWNANCFNAKGLTVRVEVPGHVRDMEDMDVSSTKLFKRQQKTGFGLSRVGLDGAGVAPDGKQRRRQRRDENERMKAGCKGRIVIIPTIPIVPIGQGRSPIPQAEQRLLAGPLVQYRELKDDEMSAFEPLLPMKHY